MEGEVGLRLSAVGWCVHVWRFVGAWRRCATQCVAGRSASAAHSSSSSRLATAVRCHSRISCSMHMDPVGRNAYDSDFVFYAWIDRAGRRMERRRGRAKIRDQLIFCLTTIFNLQSSISIWPFVHQHTHQHIHLFFTCVWAGVTTVCPDCVYPVFTPVSAQFDTRRCRIQACVRPSCPGLPRCFPSFLHRLVFRTLSTSMLIRPRMNRNGDRSD